MKGKCTKSWPLIQKTYPKIIWLVKKEKGIYQGKTCFSKVLSINESALYDVTISKRKTLIKWQWVIQSE